MPMSAIRGISLVVKHSAQSEMGLIRAHLLNDAESSPTAEMASDGPEKLREMAERIRDTEILIREEGRRSKEGYGH